MVEGRGGGQAGGGNQIDVDDVVKVRLLGPRASHAPRIEALPHDAHCRRIDASALDAQPGADRRPPRVGHRQPGVDLR